MPETSLSVIKRYLEDAVTTERNAETQLRAFAGEGSDEEVQGAFAAHAGMTHSQLERLTARLNSLGSSSPSAAKTFLAHLFALTPRTEQIGHQQEERTMQNLVAAYTAAQSESALYEALQAAAEAAGDEDTQQLAQNLQAEEQDAAAHFWGFLRSRTKIAFNLLTIAEVDPVLNPRASQSRVVK